MNKNTFEARSKLACEPCRKKKTKCPGEQPSCSFCQRLNQRCTYTRKIKPGRVSKTRNDSHAHIQRLESRIDQIHNTLQGLTDQPRTDVIVGMSFNQNEALKSHMSDRGGSRPDSVPGPSLASTQPASNALSFLPPPAILSQMIDTYNTMIHLQPFPLFDPATLLSQLMRWPRYLQNSFLAITLIFSDHPVYFDGEYKAAETYSDLARNEVIPLTTEETSSIEVIKSLCLLALYDTAIHRENRVSVTISIATSLWRALARDSPLSPLEDVQEKEEICRCFSTIFMLERISNKGPYIMKLDITSPLQSSNMPCPKTPPTINRRSSFSFHSSSISATDRSFPSGSILTNCLQLISLWDKAIEYMEQRKLGQSANAWENNSVYSQIEEKIYTFETGLAPVHRFKNVDFCNRPPGEITEYREYWSAWLLLQTTYHSVHALLNHPLFHIFRHDLPRQHVPEVRPPSFTQRSIDQALLHAGWTSRLIRTAREMNIKISNPMIAQEVIVCATIHWIFSFANDSSVSQRAVSDLDECQRFLNDIAFSWPQLGDKALALERLSNVAKNADYLLGRRNLPVATLPLLWNLIDPCVSDIDLTVFSRLNTLGEQVPTDHLLRLRDSPSRGSAHNSQSRTSPDLTQYPVSIMDDSFIFSEGCSGLLDLRNLGDFGPLGDL